jgi:Domain of unknown function (DUF5610)
MQVAVNDPYSTFGAQASNPNNFQNYDAKQSSDALVLSSTFVDNSEQVEVNFQDLYKSLTITSKQIVDKLNDILKSKLPNGLQSLKPEEVTPEASADFVVRGVTSLFSAFAKQNKDLSAEDLVKKFIEEAKKGVEQGYGDAKEVLESLGALKIDGVEDGIGQTRELILKKLDKFAELKLEELTGKSAVSTEVAESSKNELLKQSAGGLLDLAA